MERKREMPGPKGLPWFGSQLEFLFNRIPFHEKLMRDFGHERVVRFKIGRKSVYLLNDLDDIKEVFITNGAHFIRHGNLRRVIGDGILTSNGYLHKQHRGFLSSSFSQDKIRQYSHLFVESAKALRDDWGHGRVVNIEKEMEKISFRIIGKALFSKDLSEKAKPIAEAIRTISKFYPKFLMPWANLFLSLPFPDTVRFKRAKQKINVFIYALIEAQRTDSQENNSLVQSIAKLKDRKTGKFALSDAQIRDEVMTLFFAGQETVGTALTWACYALAKHPDIFRKVQAEVDSQLNGREPKYDDLVNLKYLRMVLSETMRLYPPIWTLGRTPLHGYPLGDTVLERGSLVTINQYLLHRNPRWYPNPLQFDPERFTEEEKNKRPTLAYLPFGLGRHRCLGESFAWAEGLLILATLVQKWEWLLVSKAEPKFFASVSLRPRNGLQIKLQKRHGIKRATRPVEKMGGVNV